MRQFEHIAFQRIGAESKMQPPLVGIGGHDEAGRGLIPPGEQERARFIGQRQLQRVVLMAGRERAAPAQAQAQAELMPHQFFRRETHGLGILGAIDRDGQVIECQHQFEAVERAQRPMVPERIINAGDLAAKTFAPVVPIAPDEERAERRHVGVARAVGNAVEAQIERGHRAAIARGDGDRFASQRRGIGLAGARGDVGLVGP